MKDYKEYYEGLDTLLGEYLRCPDEIREIHLYNFIEHTLKQRDAEWKALVEQVALTFEVNMLIDENETMDEWYENLQTTIRQRLNQLLQDKGVK